MFMKLINLVLLLFILSSCYKPSNYEKIESFYHQFKNGDFNQFKRVIVINEGGTCLNCNNIFARSQVQKVNDPANLFIVSAQGTRVDISAYISKNAPNLIMDYKNEFSHLNLVKGCTIFELENKKIVKTTLIKANNVTEFGKIQ